MTILLIYLFCKHFMGTHSVLGPAGLTNGSIYYSLELLLPASVLEFHMTGVVRCILSWLSSLGVMLSRLSTALRVAHSFVGCVVFPRVSVSQCVYPSTCRQTLVSFLVPGVRNQVSVNIGGQVFLCPLHSCLLGVHLGAELLVRG